MSGHQGRAPGNTKSPSVRQAALTLARERYGDFGPTLAADRRVPIFAVVHEIADPLFDSTPKLERLLSDARIR